MYDYFATDDGQDNAANDLSVGVAELTVHEGDIVKVLQMDDGSGWSVVACNGKTGVIPTSYMQPVDTISTPSSPALSRRASASDLLLNMSSLSLARSEKTTTESVRNRVLMSPNQSFAHAVVQLGKKSTVLFDYKRTASDEISVRYGQTVFVTRKDDGSGWTRVSDLINEGLMPTSYLK